MADIVPFCAIRPTRDKVSLVATRSYLSYSNETLVEKLNNNPFTFLHIINPEFSENKVAKNRDEKFRMVKDKFNEFKNNGVFISENKPLFYIYQKVNNYGKTFNGIIGAASVKDYISGKIKKHEATIEKREKLFKEYLNKTCFNAEPVLLTYPNQQQIDKIISNYISKRAEYEFSTTNKSVHKLWLVTDSIDIKTIQESFKKIDALYIADGHHRFASSALLYEENKSDNSSNKKYCMSYLIGEDQLNIINYNRLIKDLNGLSEEEFIEQLAENFNIRKENSTVQPKNENEIGLYISGQWYLISYKQEKYNLIESKVDQLSPSILFNHILNPILGINDARNDNRLSYFDGTYPTSKLQNKIDNKLFSAAFILKTIAVDSLIEIANNEQTMPPKSTFVQPKLRSGMLIYNLE